MLFGDVEYKPRSSKASLVIRLAHMYIHAVLSRSMNRRGGNTLVLTRLNVLYLYSMVQSFPIHLGYILTDNLSHQGQYVRVRVLFFRPYITQLIRGMGHIEAIQGAEKVSSSLHH